MSCKVKGKTNVANLPCKDFLIFVLVYLPGGDTYSNWCFLGIFVSETCLGKYIIK